MGREARLLSSIWTQTSLLLVVVVVGAVEGGLFDLTPETNQGVVDNSLGGGAGLDASLAASKSIDLDKGKFDKPDVILFDKFDKRPPPPPFQPPPPPPRYAPPPQNYGRPCKRDVNDQEQPASNDPNANEVLGGDMGMGDQTRSAPAQIPAQVPNASGIHQQQARSAPEQIPAQVPNASGIHQQQARSAPEQIPAQVPNASGIHQQQARSAPEQIPAQVPNPSDIHQQQARSAPEQIPAQAPNASDIHQQQARSAPEQIPAQAPNASDIHQQQARSTPEWVPAQVPNASDIHHQQARSLPDVPRKETQEQDEDRDTRGAPMMPGGAPHPPQHILPVQHNQHPGPREIHQMSEDDRNRRAISQEFGRGASLPPQLYSPPPQNHGRPWKRDVNSQEQPASNHPNAMKPNEVLGGAMGGQTRSVPQQIPAQAPNASGIHQQQAQSAPEQIPAQAPNASNIHQQQARSAPEQIPAQAPNTSGIHQQQARSAPAQIPAQVSNASEIHQQQARSAPEQIPAQVPNASDIQQQQARSPPDVPRKETEEQDEDRDTRGAPTMPGAPQPPPHILPVRNNQQPGPQQIHPMSEDDRNWRAVSPKFGRGMVDRVMNYFH